MKLRIDPSRASRYLAPHAHTRWKGRAAIARPWPSRRAIAAAGRVIEPARAQKRPVRELLEEKKAEAIGTGVR